MEERPGLKPGPAGAVRRLGGPRPARVLHVRCGADIRDRLARAGVAGDYLEFADPVCSGPVPADLPEPKLHEVRAGWLAAQGLGVEAALAARLADEAAGLAAAGDYGRVVIWSEHDPYDQFVLLRLLAELPPCLAEGARLYLIEVDRHPSVERFLGLGQLSAADLAALLPTARPVPAAALPAATAVWEAYRAGAVADLPALAAAAQPWLPLLPAALRRRLQDLPWLGDGLGLTERLLLQALAREARTPASAAAALYRRLDPMPYLGDAMLWPLLRRLAGGPSPLLSPPGAPDAPLRLTGFGRRVLAGAADRLAAIPADDWLGGCRIAGARPAWRWEEAAGRPV